VRLASRLRHTLKHAHGTAPRVAASVWGTWPHLASRKPTPRAQRRRRRPEPPLGRQRRRWRWRRRRRLRRRRARGWRHRRPPPPLARRWWWQRRMVGGGQRRGVLGAATGAQQQPVSDACAAAGLELEQPTGSPAVEGGGGALEDARSGGRGEGAHVTERVVGVGGGRGRARRQVGRDDARGALLRGSRKAHRFRSRPGEPSNERQTGQAPNDNRDPRSRPRRGHSGAAAPRPTSSHP
jgi:hypothetical protein